MSKEIKNALWEDYENISNLIEDLNIEEKGGSYEIALKERDNIRNELIKMYQIEQEQIISNKQSESDNKKDKIHNIINITTFTISTLVSLYSIARTFRFDETGTVTSTLGRNILNGVVPKMLKR